jgi:AraC family transcriptional regulator
VDSKSQNCGCYEFSHRSFFVGKTYTIENTVRFLYSEWLPQSGEEWRYFPIYFQRVKFLPDVPENESIVDIFLPLDD